MILRFYSEHETPQLGDVIQLFEGAFGASIITSVWTEKIPSGRCFRNEAWAMVERSHLSVNENCPQIQIGIERIELPLSRIKKDMKVYVTGSSGRIDNRKR